MTPGPDEEKEAARPDGRRPMLDARFKLVTSVILLALMAAVFLPAATDGLSRYASFQMFLVFGGFFAWQAAAALRAILRGRNRDR